MFCPDLDPNHIHALDMPYWLPSMTVITPRCSAPRPTIASVSRQDKRHGWLNEKISKSMEDQSQWEK